MPPSRRRVLRAWSISLAIGAAGCLSTELTGNSFPTPTDCPANPQVPESDPHSNGEALPPIPEPPELLDDEDAVTDFVTAYELAYRSREMTTKFDSPIVSFNLDAVASIRDAQATSVLADIEGMAHGRVDYDQDDSDPPAHFDGGRYLASYLVTSDAVWRVQAGRDADTSELDPHEDGELLECY